MNLDELITQRDDAFINYELSGSVHDRGKYNKAVQALRGVLEDLGIEMDESDIDPLSAENSNIGREKAGEVDISDVDDVGYEVDY